MQRDLDNMYKWIDDNNMKANGKKFEHLPAGHNGQYSLYLTNEGNLIEPAKNVRDLGVFISSDLKFTYHIKKHCKKGTRHGQLDTSSF